MLFQTLIYLLAAHALCDYALQGDWLSKAKNPAAAPIAGEVIWPLALAQHALIQAVGVHLVTKSWVLAGVEFATHFGIDLVKTKGGFTYNGDQFLHITFRVAYALAIYRFGQLP